MQTRLVTLAVLLALQLALSGCIFLGGGHDHGHDHHGYVTPHHDHG